MVSTWDQSLVVFKKNLLLYYQERQFYGEYLLIFGIFLFLLIGKLTSSITLLSIGSEFLPMFLLVSSRYIITSLIQEKSDRQKEIQKIMGLKQSAYQLGWLMFNLSRILALTIIFLIPSVPSHCFGPETETIPQTNIKITYLSSSEIISAFILFALGLLAQQYFISTLFDVPKNGADLSMFLNIFGSLFSELLNITYFQNNEWIVILFSILFPTFLFDTYLYYQIRSQVLPKPVDISKVMPKPLYFGLLGAETIFYGILYLYLEQVLPNEYGTNKHPLFFLGKKNDFNNVPITNQVELGNMNEPLIGTRNSELQEDHSSAIYHEVFENPKQVKRAISIRHVKKCFGDLIAVNEVTLQFYDSQILCLLGHNGAGKTTLMSILTGLIKRDGGQIVYYGEDVEFDVIRNYLGFCPQRDVLYESMTCDQHLYYYGRIKGIDEQLLQMEVDEIINKCDLQCDRNKLSKDLSGGTKRKLSLAISLMGRSKVIFLDEPTSGMDPVSRQKIWEILLQIKNEGRCLVLTTHHLDEAEILSERLAIMAKGKLLTVGSVDFIKMNFGVGYHLSFYDKLNNQQQWNEKQSQLQNIVQQFIPQAKLNTQTSQDNIQFQVPFKHKDKFLPLFEQLERDKTIQVNLIMNTLEEAFINIGMDEEQFLNKASGGRSNSISDSSHINIDVNDEFNKIIPPQCLGYPPVFSFWSQLWACLMKKHYTMTPKRYFMCIFMPGTYAFVGPLIANAINNSISPPSDNRSLKALQTSIALENTYIFIVIGACVASSQIGSAPVEEREKKQKYALNVMGCRILPYWFGYYFYDISICIFLFFIFLFSVIIFGLDVINYANIYGLVICCYLAFFSLSYLLSWLFNSFLSAVRSIVLIQMFVNFMIASAIFVLCINIEGLLWVLCIIFPSLAFMGGLFSFYNERGLESQDSNLPFKKVPPIVFIVILILQATIYFFITYLIDNREQLAANNGGVLSTNQDEDVINEEARVQDFRCKDRIKAKKISKIYANGFQAVRGTSFGIEVGQIFGLLGPNGAGKSTTFNMITSKLKPSTGTILLEEQEVKKGLGHVYQNVGICPQFDSLYDIVTVRKHLEIWSYLKGLRGDNVEQCVIYFLKVMQLEAYENTLASQLSGGNKRKLCVALALMGGTNMQFFDEPSSGVDPIARRFLWNAIQQGVKLRQSSVILTTHTMDEAESLCNKIAIQVNGRFACLGSVQHLRQKFGDGYRVVIEPLNESTVQQIIQEITNQFGQIYIQNDIHTGRIVCKLPLISFQFYPTFYFFQEKLQKQLNLIKDFQISQPNLEQIFMSFASQQVIEPQILRPQDKGRFHVTACCGNDEDD